MIGSVVNAKSNVALLYLREAHVEHGYNEFCPDPFCLGCGGCQPEDHELDVWDLILPLGAPDQLDQPDLELPGALRDPGGLGGPLDGPLDEPEV